MICADAANPDAYKAILEGKQRPKNKPLALVVPDQDRARDLLHFTPDAERLAAAFWPGDLALFLSWRDRADAARYTVVGSPALTTHAPRPPGRPRPSGPRTARGHHRQRLRRRRARRPRPGHHPRRGRRVPHRRRPRRRRPGRRRLPGGQPPHHRRLRRRPYPPRPRRPRPPAGRRLRPRPGPTNCVTAPPDGRLPGREAPVTERT
ncbi:Sua5/YciO/YrdC/YwlC family protein [Streptomyces goshikiensis]